MIVRAACVEVEIGRRTCKRAGPHTTVRVSPWRVCSSGSSRNRQARSSDSLMQCKAFAPRGVGDSAFFIPGGVGLLFVGGALTLSILSEQDGDGRDTLAKKESNGFEWAEVPVLVWPPAQIREHLRGEEVLGVNK